MRLTNKQNLLLLNIPKENLPVLLGELDAAGLVYRPSNFRRGCVSCTGIEFCNIAVAETKNRMIRMVEAVGSHQRLVPGKNPHPFQRLSRRVAASTRSPTSACAVPAPSCPTANRSTLTTCSSADALGENRRFNELLKGKIIAADVHHTIDKLLRFYDTRKQDERESFAQLCDRVPKAEFLNALN